MHLPWVLLAVLSPSPSLDEANAHATPHVVVADEPTREASTRETQVAQQKPKPKPKPKPDPDYCPPCGRG